MSLCRAHYARVSAQMAGTREGAGGEKQTSGNAYEQMLAQLYEHKRSLKAIQSIAKKIEFKRSIVAQYDHWVAGVLQGNSGAQDDVFMSVLVWQIDIANYARVLPMAGYALTHQLKLPEHYQRDLASLIAEEVADTELKKRIEKIPQDIDALRATLYLVADRDMADQISAKLKKALGLALYDQQAEQEAQNLDLLAEALELLRNAYSLDSRAGVKKEIERLERLVNSLEASVPTALTSDPATAAGGGTETAVKSATSTTAPTAAQKTKNTRGTA